LAADEDPLEADEQIPLEMHLPDDEASLQGGQENGEASS
jgi:hypothetical protein